MRIDQGKMAGMLARKDMQLKELSALSGVCLQTLSLVRNGKSCREDTARRIAAALGVDVTELMED